MLNLISKSIVAGGNYQYAALIVTHGSKSINLINNVVKNSYVGISIGDKFSNSVDQYAQFTQIRAKSISQFLSGNLLWTESIQFRTYFLRTRIICLSQHLKLFGQKSLHLALRFNFMQLTFLQNHNSIWIKIYKLYKQFETFAYQQLI